MINAKGETIYTNAEIAYELGISPATVGACGRRLYGSGRIQYWTINDVKLLVEYIKSISIEEDAKRLANLHNVISESMNGICLDGDEDIRKMANKDIHLNKLEDESAIKRRGIF